VNNNIIRIRIVLDINYDEYIIMFYKFTEKVFYGFGFGSGMGIAYNINDYIKNYKNGSSHM
jgi:hypothetical protein